MADGDLGITFTIAGGASKSITIEKATYDLAKAYAIAQDPIDNITDDASYVVSLVNKAGMGIVNVANKQQNQAAIPTEKTFTKAT